MLLDLFLVCFFQLSSLFRVVDCTLTTLYRVVKRNHHLETTTITITLERQMRCHPCMYLILRCYRLKMFFHFLKHSRTGN